MHFHTQPDNTSREDDSPSTVDDTNEPLTPLPQDKVEGSSRRACQQGHRRKMSLFTEGVPALSLVSSTIDEQVCVCVCVCVCAGLHLGGAGGAFAPPPLGDLLPPLQICCLPKLVSQHIH